MRGLHGHRICWVVHLSVVAMGQSERCATVHYSSREVICRAQSDVPQRL